MPSKSGDQGKSCWFARIEPYYTEAQIRMNFFPKKETYKCINLAKVKMRQAIFWL